jgi:hypothetical protein
MQSGSVLSSKFRGVSYSTATIIILRTIYYSINSGRVLRGRPIFFSAEFSKSQFSWADLLSNATFSKRFSANSSQQILKILFRCAFKTEFARFSENFQSAISIIPFRYGSKISIRFIFLKQIQPVLHNCRDSSRKNMFKSADDSQPELLFKSYNDFSASDSDSTNSYS